MLIYFRMTYLQFPHNPHFLVPQVSSRDSEITGLKREVDGLKAEVMRLELGISQLNQVRPWSV